LRGEALDAMLKVLTDPAAGNPSSLHAEGQRAKRILDSARDVIATSLGAEFSEISFTSGGTESDNAAIIGAAMAQANGRKHVVVSRIEHEAVLQTAAYLERMGFAVSYVAPNRLGIVTPDAVAAAMRDDTTLVSVMHANNEIGTIQPIREIAAVAHSAGALMHTDAVQTYGQLDVDVKALGVDMLTVSGHKIYGPQGTGALYVRDGVPIEPFMHGGGQERERRAGTENVAGIAGFAAAVTCLLAERPPASERMAVLRDRLSGAILTRCDNSRLNGDPALRLPNNVSISFLGRDAETLLLALDMAGLAVSSGSACTSGSIEPSHVLLALGLGVDDIGATIRFTLGKDTSIADIDEAVERVAGVVGRIDTLGKA